MADLPIVNFGNKYKGKPVTEFLKDTAYVEWCKQQEFCKKTGVIYNIVMNNTITNNNSSSKTPEHNKIQNLFLKETNIEKFIRYFYNLQHPKNVIYTYKATFEGIFNWDVILDNNSYKVCECKWDDDDQKCICTCESHKEWCTKQNIPAGYFDDEDGIHLSNIYCEIKPLLGDDYPAVLRKMKTQIELTNNHVNKKNEEIRESMKKERWEGTYRNHDIYKFCLQNYTLTPYYVLLVKDFKSETSKEELIQIFNQSRIKVIFLNNVFNELNTNSLLLDNNLNVTKELEKNEMKALQEKLKNAEEKIKHLEIELNELKSKKDKPNKTIDYYFKK